MALLTKRGKATSIVLGAALATTGGAAIFAASQAQTRNTTLKSPLSLVVEQDGGVAQTHRDERFKVNGRANVTVEKEDGVWVSGGKLEDEDGEVYLGKGLAGKWEPNSTKHLAWNGQLYTSEENTFLGQRVIVPGDWVQRTLDVHNISPCAGTVTVYAGLDHYLHEEFTFFGPWRVNSDDAAVHGLQPWEGSIPGGTDLAEHVEFFWNLAGVPQCLTPWAPDPLLSDPHAWADGAELQEHAERPADSTRICTMVPVESGESPMECPGQWPAAVKALLADPANVDEFGAAENTISCAVSLENMVDEAVRLEIENHPELTDTQRADLYRTRLLMGLNLKTDHALTPASYALLDNPGPMMEPQRWQQLLSLADQHGIPMHGWAGIVADVSARTGSPIDLATNIPLVPIGQVYMTPDAVQPITFGKRVDLMLDHHNTEYDDDANTPVHDDSVLAFDLYVELECDVDGPVEPGPEPSKPSTPPSQPGQPGGPATGVEAASQPAGLGSLSKTGISLAALFTALAALLVVVVARKRREQMRLALEVQQALAAESSAADRRLRRAAPVSKPSRLPFGGEGR